MRTADIFRFLLTYNGGCNWVTMTCPYDGQSPTIPMIIGKDPALNLKVELSQELTTAILRDVESLGVYRSTGT